MKMVHSIMVPVEGPSAVKLVAVLLNDGRGKIGIGSEDWVINEGRPMSTFEKRMFFPGFIGGPYDETTLRDGADVSREATGQHTAAAR